MTKKLAKIKYLPNNFQIIENGDYVECAISGKKINLENLTYWNVELQEAYFSYKEAFKKRENINQNIGYGLTIDGNKVYFLFLSALFLSASLYEKYGSCNSTFQ